MNRNVVDHLHLHPSYCGYLAHPEFKSSIPKLEGETAEGPS